LDLVPGMVVSRPGHQDAAWFRKLFQASRDVDTIAIPIAALDHHVTEIDADAQDDLSVLGQAGIGLGHAVLEVYGTLHSVDRASELDQCAIADDLEDTALVLGDQWLQHLPAPRLEGSERSGLIPLHKPAVADHVGGEDGGQAALRVLFGHGIAAT